MLAGGRVNPWLTTVDGQNPTPKKPWLKPLFVGIYRESSKARLLRGCRILSIHSKVSPFGVDSLLLEGIPLFSEGFIHPGSSPLVQDKPT